MNRADSRTDDTLGMAIMNTLLLFISGLGKGRTDYKYNGRCALNRVNCVTPKILQKGSFAANSKSVTVSYGVWWFLRVGRIRVGDPSRYAGG